MLSNKRFDSVCLNAVRLSGIFKTLATMKDTKTPHAQTAMRSTHKHKTVGASIEGLIL